MPPRPRKEREEEMQKLIDEVEEALQSLLRQGKVRLAPNHDGQPKYELVPEAERVRPTEQ